MSDNMAPVLLALLSQDYVGYVFSFILREPILYGYISQESTLHGLFGQYIMVQYI